MKKHLHSIWFRVVLSFFCTLVFTCILIGCSAYLTIRLSLWKYFPIKMGVIHFIILLALASIIIGTILSMIVVQFVLAPVMELSNAMQKVAEGNYTIQLEESSARLGEVHHLRSNFNHMVRELNSTETLHADFISNVSHEFKTPLATITGYATLLQDDTLTDEERNEYIDIIVKSSKELSTMTGNILSLSRLENQTIISEKELYRVDEQIRQIILRMEPLWEQKNLDINPELDNILWFGNKELTAHIWGNLLDNAVKFTPTGGAISITAHADDEWLTVTIQDTGSGMIPEVQKHIFDKFYQGDTSHKKKGNGLGLSLVRQIVTLCGGSIQVESTPDLGSTFTVLLPMEEALYSSM